MGEKIFLNKPESVTDREWDMARTEAPELYRDDRVMNSEEWEAHHLHMGALAIRLQEEHKQSITEAVEP